MNHDTPETDKLFAPLWLKDAPPTDVELHAANQSHKRLERERDEALAALRLMRDTFAGCSSPAQGGPDPFTWVYRDVFAVADSVLAETGPAIRDSGIRNPVTP